MLNILNVLHLCICLFGITVQSLLLPRPRWSSLTVREPQTKIWIESSDPKFIDTQEATNNEPLLMLFDASEATTSSVLPILMNDTTFANFLPDMVMSLEKDDTSVVTELETGQDASSLIESGAIWKSDNENDSSSFPSLREKIVEAPSVAKIFQFAVPAVGVWLCNPLLS